MLRNGVQAIPVWWLPAATAPAAPAAAAASCVVVHHILKHDGVFSCLSI